MKHLIMILLIVCVLSPGLAHAAEHSALSDPFTLDTRSILGHSALSDPFTLDTRSILGHSALSNIFTLNTRNSPPVAEDDAYSANEDEALTVAAPGVLANDTDADIDDTLTVASIDTTGTAGQVTDWNADGSFTYDPNGKFEHLAVGEEAEDTFGYTVSDDNGGNDTATITITIIGVNDPPVADANGPYIGSEGSSVTLDGSASSDVDGSIVLYEWDVDDDGIYDISTSSSTVSYVWPDYYTGDVVLRVTDDLGATDTSNASATISNVAPTVNAGDDQTVNEGDLVSLDPATFNDKGTLDTHTAIINWGDGSPADIGVVKEAPFGPPGSTAGADGTVDGSHVYGDNGVYIVTVTVTDDEGASGSDTLTVTVNNVASTVNAGDDQTVNEGDLVSLDPATFNDKGTLDTHTAIINWGDGSPADIGVVTEAPLGPPGSTAGADGAVDGSHAYGDNGVYIVTVTVTDDEGASGSDTITVTVNNVAPTVTQVTVSDDEIMAGDHVDFGGEFTDPGWLDTHTAEWDFGDGTSAEAGAVVEENVPPDSTGTVTGDHSYFKAGEHTVTLTVTDDDGDSGKGTLLMKVEAIPATIVFDPETLNRQGGEKWVTVYIELPIRGDVKKIDLSSILLNDKVKPETNKKYDFVELEDSYIMDVDEDGELERMVKFLRKDVQKLFEDDEGEVEVVVTGCVEYTNDHGDTGCAAFKGTDTVKIIDTPKALAAPACVAPVRFQALAAFPQPCNPEVWLPYTLGKDVGVKVSIYSSSGMLIRTLDLGHKPAGSYISKDKAAYWDGRNEAGEQVSSGVYFYTIQAGDFAATKKMVVTR